jgi:pantoate ligase / CMP/dCMP kinase
LVADLNLPVEIIPCPILREPSGLACSSRNQYLTSEQRQQATVIYRSLQQAKDTFDRGARDRQSLLQTVAAELATEPAIVPEYIELIDPNCMTPLTQVTDTGLLAIAATLGSTRLIDNLVLHSRQPILAIDGPAGAGKSTIARRCAQALGLLYLDTGAMYRAVTWLALESGISVENDVAIAELVSQCDIELSANPDPQQPSQVLIKGQDVTHAIRSLAVTAQVSAIAAQPSVRQELVKQQRRYGQRGGIVVEGRDIGTYVFPDAELKIFLTASVPERARRRQQDLKHQGETLPTLEELEVAIFERDRKDASRTISPLRKAADAVEINTDHLSIAEVTEQIVALYQQRFQP